MEVKQMKQALDALLPPKPAAATSEEGYGMEEYLYAHSDVAEVLGQLVGQLLLNSRNLYPEEYREDAEEFLAKVVEWAQHQMECNTASKLTGWGPLTESLERLGEYLAAALHEAAGRTPEAEQALLEERNREDQAAADAEAEYLAEGDAHDEMMRKVFGHDHDI